MNPQSVDELIHWLTIAQMRWGNDITYLRVEGVLGIYQDGKLRANLALDERPWLKDFADDEA
jgi:hypothetical protein